jgi:hypothetical protein
MKFEFQVEDGRQLDLLRRLDILRQAWMQNHRKLKFDDDVFESPG